MAIIKRKKKKKKNFLNNGDLLAETIKSQAEDKMTDKLAQMLMILCKRYTSSRNGNFTNYTFLEDMQSYSLVNLVVAWKKFDPTKSNNPFAFYTQCVHNSYLQFLKQEKRQRDIRDKLLITEGLEPSYAYAESEKKKLKEEANISKTAGSPAERTLEY